MLTHYNRIVISCFKDFFQSVNTNNLAEVLQVLKELNFMLANRAPELTAHYNIALEPCQMPAEEVHKLVKPHLHCNAAYNPEHRSNKPPTKGTQQPSTQSEKPKCWHCQGECFRKDCPTAPKQSSPSKYKSTKEKQCNLIKMFCKKFQDKMQINKISTPAGDNCNEEFNNFISEFENIMLEDSDDSSA